MRGRIRREHESRQGKVGLYRIGNPIPDDVEVLPGVDAVRRHLDNLDNLATDPGDLTPPSPSQLPEEDAPDLDDAVDQGNSPGVERVCSRLPVLCKKPKKFTEVTTVTAGLAYLACGCHIPESELATRTEVPF